MAQAIKDGKLAPCPATPNCVSSAATGRRHSMPPIELHGTVDATREKIVRVIEAMDRAQIIIAEGVYVHAEFRSKLFRFVDDVEFQIDQTAGLIHFRSASRLGRSDLGVNRKRMERISRELAQK